MRSYWRPRRLPSCLEVTFRAFPAIGYGSSGAPWRGFSEDRYMAWNAQFLQADIQARSSRQVAQAWSFIQMRALAPDFLRFCIKRTIDQQFKPKRESWWGSGVIEAWYLGPQQRIMAAVLNLPWISSLARCILLVSRCLCCKVIATTAV